MRVAAPAWVRPPLGAVRIRPDPATAVCGDVYRTFPGTCQACHNRVQPMASADVVVIGGGVNGVSTAFNLARLGVRRVTVVERRYLAAGATGKSGSLVRMHYTNEAEYRLALESLKVFRDFANIVGGDSRFHQSGLDRGGCHVHDAATA